MRHIDEAGLKIVKEFEGLRLEAYLCPAGVWTVGWGSTKNVHAGQQITEEEAEDLLKLDLESAERAVSKYITVPLTDNQFAALVSLTFNVGPGWMVKKYGLFMLLQAGSYLGAAERMLQYNKANGEVLRGLVRRREAESTLFSEPGETTEALVLKTAWKSVSCPECDWGFQVEIPKN